MRALALSALCLAALVSLAPSARSQVSQVPNTGCPGATYPSTVGTPRIGQPFTFSWSCAVPNRQLIAMLGADSGGGYRFDQPFTCDPGPCVWHPGPIGGLYYAWPTLNTSGGWTVNLPSDPQLVGTSWGIQCVCWCT